MIRFHHFSLPLPLPSPSDLMPFHRGSLHTWFQSDGFPDLCLPGREDGLEVRLTIQLFPNTIRHCSCSIILYVDVLALYRSCHRMTKVQGGWWLCMHKVVTQFKIYKGICKAFFYRPRICVCPNWNDLKGQPLCYLFVFRCHLFPSPLHISTLKEFRVWVALHASHSDPCSFAAVHFDGEPVSSQLRWHKSLTQKKKPQFIETPFLLTQRASLPLHTTTP